MLLAVAMVTALCVFPAGTQSVTFSNLVTAKAGYSAENRTRINTLGRIKSGAKLLKLQPPPRTYPDVPDPPQVTHVTEV